MKRILGFILVAVLVFGMTSGFAAEPGPPNWDISGDWEVTLVNPLDREFKNVVQLEDGTVSGEFWYWSGSDLLYGGTLHGRVDGNLVYMHYARPTSSYTGDFNGEITKYGMSGTFTDSNNNSYTWSTDGSPTLLWEARITGGGQLIEASDELNKKGRPIDYKISFGGGAFIVNGSYYLDGLEVTFHNVSSEILSGGKFVATEISQMNFNFSEGVANYTVLGTFNGEAGYKMIVRVQDAGEPGNQDNLRFELFKGTSKIYDTYPNDFPGESSTDGTARHFLDKGNLQVEDFR